MSIEKLYELFVASDGISTDTRKIKENTIFFALKGENFNANKFAAEALQQGCSYAVVDEEEHAVSDQYILVENVQKTLQDLARHHRRQFDIPVIGITGSNGKTTTKELMGAVLSRKYKALVTEGNLNNQLGVPFTLLRLTKEHEIAIIEMGASHPGDIKELAEIAEPTHGIITNIGAAHIEGFGSLDGVIKTKKELYDYLGANKGIIFYHGDDQTLTGNLPDLTENFAYGQRNGEVKGELVRLTPFVEFKWTVNGYDSDLISSHLVGKYNFINFLAAAAIGHFFYVDPEEISDALAKYSPSNNRSQITKTDRNTLIVDCYNANPTSMKAALDSFLEVEHSNKLAILGDMLELGEISDREHQNIIDSLEENQMNAILVGKEFLKRNSSIKTYLNVTELMENENLEEICKTLILLKGSRGIRLENLISKL